MAQGIPNNTPARQLASLREHSEEGPGDCRTWVGHMLLNGYGVMRVMRRETYVHRLAYELEVGPIPEGYEIDHLCRNRACLAVAHLEAVPPRVNNLRGVGAAAQNAPQDGVRPRPPIRRGEHPSHGPWIPPMSDV